MMENLNEFILKQGIKTIEHKTVGEHCLIKARGPKDTPKYYVVTVVNGGAKRCFAIMEEEYYAVNGSRSFGEILGNEALGIPFKPFRHKLIAAEDEEDQKYVSKDQRIWFTDVDEWVKKEDSDTRIAKLFVPWMNKHLNIIKTHFGETSPFKNIILRIGDGEDCLENGEYYYSVPVGRPYITSEELDQYFLNCKERFYTKLCLEDKEAELLREIDDILDVRYPGYFISNGRNGIKHEGTGLEIFKKGVVPGVYFVNYGDTHKIMTTAEVVLLCKSLFDKEEKSDGKETGV